MQRLRVQSPKLIIHGDEKNKGTPRTNTRKVVCTECGTNINSENKIIHSKRMHPGKIVKFQPHLESDQQAVPCPAFWGPCAKKRLEAPDIGHVF